MTRTLRPAALLAILGMTACSSGPAPAREARLTREPFGTTPSGEQRSPSTPIVLVSVSE